MEWKSTRTYVVSEKKNDGIRTVFVLAIGVILALATDNLGFLLITVVLEIPQLIQRWKRSVTERNAEAKAEAARMERLSQQALEQEEALFASVDSETADPEKQKEGAGHEEE